MAGPLCCGQIVWAEIADANGIRKDRPAVIVTPDDEITASGLLKVVGPLQHQSQFDFVEASVNHAFEQVRREFQLPIPPCGPFHQFGLIVQP